MRVVISEDSISIVLKRWEKALGLMRNIEVPLADVSDARVVEDPVQEAMGAGIKVGLRVPWLIFIARTIRLEEAFVVRRNIPGLSFAVGNHPPLKRVLVSTPEAEELVQRLSRV